MTIENLAKFLVTVGIQAKWFHWQTFTKTEHETLGAFYDSWNELVDTFIESYSGRYQRPVGGALISIDQYKEGGAMAMVNMAAVQLASAEVRGAIKDTDLNNILDELQGLANRTAYLLSMKH